jgi:hypothetical protein
MIGAMTVGPTADDAAAAAAAGTGGADSMQLTGR